MNILTKDTDGFHKFSKDDVLLNLTKREGLQLAKYLISQSLSSDSVYRTYKFIGYKEKFEEYEIIIYMEPEEK